MPNRITFNRKIVHFQILVYANELICIIVMKDRFYLPWDVDNELQCKGVTLLKFQ